ncbi:hypothetical protein A3A20_02730 [Candidatus Wolfebacteria bacterium RIFCSPLOWO2_01_FULL_45_19]|uniref:TrbL/VirB6 plasmid conjugal transfer protein n=1 Tax=Candidatus Wolfebacteria bacterium RIFCSPLOWO2_01_FULL_45_19 TaxID=1802557 RepID=A0A1F8DSM8_9BACT|nr:MAG: hypothetical protein UX23_C0012G0002 [Parcubacteria group bacterium GW2011_GWB1_45_9]OGM91462.1 MAG: hypothetical protein A3A20_02730 [Candidatus Wolfebacteria bacterium RIFCSPLOWO2_01_FULL_45_19]
MMRRIKKYLKITAVFAIVIFTCLVLIAPDLVNAQTSATTTAQDSKESNWLKSLVDWTVGISLSPLTIALSAIVYAVGLIGSALLQFAAFLVGYALQLNSAILDGGNSVVHDGWGITKELANLGFVLGIIIIAFATIIRFESYGMKQLLWKLIVAALLVNFSLTIAGIFIDFAGVLSDFFLSRIAEEGVIGLQNKLVAAFQPQKLLQAETSAAIIGRTLETVLTFSGAAKLLSSIFFATLFTFLMAIALLVMVVMFFARFIILSFLLVLVPLAFLFWILPMFQHLWSRWWEEFFRWVFFAPSALFFLYLALSIATSEGRAKYIGNLAQTTAEANARLGNVMETTGVLVDNFFVNAAQMLVILGFIYAGLVLSHKISGTFSGVAVTTGGWFSNKLQTAAINRARGAAGWATTRALTVKKKGEEATYAQKFARGLAKFPVLRGIGQRLDIASQAIQERVQKRSEDLGKQSKPFFESKLSSRNFIPINREEAAAEAIHAARIGSFEKIPEKLRPQYINTIRSTGADKQFLQYRPDMAQEFGKTIAEAMRKSAPNAVDSMGPEVLKRQEVILNFSGAHLSRVFREGRAEQQQAVVSALNETDKNRGKLDAVQTQALERLLKTARKDINANAYFPEEEKPKPKKRKK